MTDTTATDAPDTAAAQAPKKGRIIAFKNLKAGADNKRPAFEGEIALAAEGDKRPVALWIKPAKDGAIVLTGTLAKDAKGQIEAMAAPTEAPEAPNALELAQTGGKSLKLLPNSLILFSNKAKTAEASSKPDYWGYATDAEAKTAYRLAAWAKIDKNGNAYIAGTVEPEQAKEKTKSKGKDRSR